MLWNAKCDKIGYLCHLDCFSICWTPARFTGSKCNLDPENDTEIDPEIDPEIGPEISPEIGPEIDPEIDPEINPEMDSSVTFHGQKKIKNSRSNLTISWSKTRSFS